jgi:hypothetical protein
MFVRGASEARGGDQFQVANFVTFSGSEIASVVAFKVQRARLIVKKFNKIDFLEIFRARDHEMPRGVGVNCHSVMGIGQ